LFEDRRIEIPDDRDLKADLKAVKRIITEAGNIRYDAKRSESGHSDRFWALALSWHASDRPHQSMAEYGFAGGRAPITAAGIDNMRFGTPESDRDFFLPRPIQPEHRYGGAL